MPPDISRSIAMSNVQVLWHYSDKPFDSLLLFFKYIHYQAKHIFLQQPRISAQRHRLIIFYFSKLIYKIKYKKNTLKTEDPIG